MLQQVYSAQVTTVDFDHHEKNIYHMLHTPNKFQETYLRSTKYQGAQIGQMQILWLLSSHPQTNSFQKLGCRNSSCSGKVHMSRENSVIFGQKTWLFFNPAKLQTHIANDDIWHKFAHPKKNHRIEILQLSGPRKFYSRIFRFGAL